MEQSKSHRTVLIIGVVYLLVVAGIFIYFGTSLLDNYWVMPARAFILGFSLVLLWLSVRDILKKPLQFISYFFFVASLFIGGLSFFLFFGL